MIEPLIQSESEIEMMEFFSYTTPSSPQPLFQYCGKKE